LSNLTSIMALKALDGLAARAEVTAQNIANAGTPGYRALKVSFEQALVDASEKGERAVQAVKPQIETDPSGQQSGAARLDMQMATASMTSARYAALVEVLSRQMQHMRVVLGT
jgi:flagellar basal-body rod protein FlgB